MGSTSPNKYTKTRWYLWSQTSAFRMQITSDEGVSRSSPYNNSRAIRASSCPRNRRSKIASYQPSFRRWFLQPQTPLLETRRGVLSARPPNFHKSTPPTAIFSPPSSTTTSLFGFSDVTSRCLQLIHFPWLVRNFHILLRNSSFVIVNFNRR